ncbi:hypothetical protein Fmac_032394 [Flemingia macrophylla]|uniref:Wall-associated receptor kinase galacturonan-binding domain-containing protein n=1 Tax=Flemingia macrophylla TaxID=520843 RepID=A0ABD1L588_9FABA
MRKSLGVMWRERMILVALVFLVHQINASKTHEQEHACPPSSCGRITNISHPFGLKGDRKSCGKNRLELACENNVTVLYLYSGKYHVQAINYDNYTIRVTDPGVQQSNCSSLPRYFLSKSNFSDDLYSGETYHYFQNRLVRSHLSQEHVFQHIVFMNCSFPVTKNRKYVDTSPCVNRNSKGCYIYAFAGDLKAKDIEVGCHIKLVAPTSWWGLDTNRYSYNVMTRHSSMGLRFHGWIPTAFSTPPRSSPYARVSPVSSSAVGSGKIIIATAGTSGKACSSRR